MHTTPQFTWRPHSQKGNSQKGNGKKLPAFAFVMGMAIAHYWHVSGNPILEFPKDSAVVRAGPTYATEMAASDRLVHHSASAAEVAAFERLVPAPAPAAEVTAADRLAHAPAPATMVAPRPDPNNSLRTSSDSAPKGSETTKRHRPASIRKAKSEPDYPALRAFLLKR